MSTCDEPIHTSDISNNTTDRDLSYQVQLKYFTTLMVWNQVHTKFLIKCTNLLRISLLSHYRILSTVLLHLKLRLTYGVAKVSPIPKISRPTIEDLRAISLLPIQSKCLEKIAFKSLKLSLLPVIHANQCAYRKGYSTTALILLIDTMSRWIDEGYNVLLQMFDLSKAFDTVSHSLLVNKLKKANISQNFIHWIADYLTNRSFSVAFAVKLMSFPVVCLRVPFLDHC